MTGMEYRVSRKEQVEEVTFEKKKKKKNSHKRDTGICWMIMYITGLQY